MNDTSSKKRIENARDQENLSTTSSAIVKHLQEIGQLSPGFEDDKQQFRAAVNSDYSLAFGCFSKPDAGLNFNDSPLGFRTGNLKQIALDQELLKKGICMMQQYDEYDIQMPKSEEPPPFLGFSKGNNGQPIFVSPSKIQQDSQSQPYIHINFESSQKFSKRKTIATPKIQASKTRFRDQKTLESNIKSHSNRLSKLLIISNSKPKTKSKEVKKRLMEYHQDSARCRLLQLEEKRIDLSDYQQPTTYNHSKSECGLLKCYLCSQNISAISSSEIISILLERYGEQAEQKLTEWYHQVSYKLYKYQKYYPELVNKRLNAANIIAQLENKYYKEESSKKQPFGLSLRNGSFIEGAAVNLIVVAVHYVPDKPYYLLQLSDGWYSMYVPIKIERKLLGNSYYITRLIENGYLYPGCKIQISNWREYPVRGILEYLKCPNQLPCIEVMYNSLIKLPNKSKLGTSSDVLYKQLSKCYPGCGLAFLCRLAVVRVYILNQSEQLYLRVANQNETYLMNVCSGACLVDEFVEKRQYEFQNIKIMPQYQLQSTRITRFRQVEQSLDFERIVEDALWNTSQKRQVNRTYDIILEIDEINQNVLLGHHKDQQYRIQVCAKMKTIQNYIGKHVLLVEVKYISLKALESNGAIDFVTTSLTKVSMGSKHKLYQQLLSS